MNKQKDFIDYLQNCNFFRKVIEHSGDLNILYDYYHDLKKCDIASESSKHFVKTRCRNTSNLLGYLLLEKELLNDDFFKINSPIVCMDLLEEYNMIFLSIYGIKTAKQQEFPGHIFTIIKLAEDMYAIYQSYVYKYETRVIIGNKKTINSYIHNYFIALNINTRKIWTSTNTDIWRHLTQVDEYKFEYDSFSVDINVYHPAERLYTENCKSNFLVSFIKNVSDKLLKDNYIYRGKKQKYLEIIQNINKDKNIEFYVLDDLGFIDPKKIEIKNIEEEPYIEVNSRKNKKSSPTRATSTKNKFQKKSSSPKKNRKTSPSSYSEENMKKKELVVIDKFFKTIIEKNNVDKVEEVVEKFASETSLYHLESLIYIFGKLDYEMIEIYLGFKIKEFLEIFERYFPNFDVMEEYTIYMHNKINIIFDDKEIGRLLFILNISKMLLPKMLDNRIEVEKLLSEEVKNIIDKYVYWSNFYNDHPKIFCKVLFDISTENLHYLFQKLYEKNDLNFLFREYQKGNFISKCQIYNGFIYKELESFINTEMTNLFDTRKYSFVDYGRLTILAKTANLSKSKINKNNFNIAQYELIKDLMN